MACFHPLTAWHHGSGGVSFTKGAGSSRRLSLPCGQCVGCRLERSRQWAVRIMHEASLHDQNCFVTLTYDEVHNPKSLVYRHFQLFMKSLRKKVGPTRFYMCGEYGEQEFRPHFHVCLFGLGFGDRTPWRKSPSGHQLYRSRLLESFWDRGTAEIGELTFDSAAYVARYCMKKVTGDMAADHYRRLDLNTGEVFDVVPEFTRMSLKPGIGRPWFDKFQSDVYPHDSVIVNGVEASPPRYYAKALEQVNPAMAGKVAYRRLIKAAACAEDSTDDRLRVREIVTRARVSSLKRVI